MGVCHGWISCSTDHKNKLKDTFYSFRYHIDFSGLQLATSRGIRDSSVYCAKKKKKKHSKNKSPLSVTRSWMAKCQLILYVDEMNKLSVNFRNWDIVFGEVLEKKIWGNLFHNFQLGWPSQYWLSHKQCKVVVFKTVPTH